MVTEQIGSCLGTKAGRGERKVFRGHEDTGGGHGAFTCLWGWFHISNLTELCTLNRCGLFYVNYTSIMPF